MKTVAKLIQNYAPDNWEGGLIIFQTLDTKEKIIIHTTNLFSESSVGQNFNLNLNPKYALISQKQNPNGNFKLLTSSMNINTEKDKKQNPESMVYNFKDLANNSLIDISGDTNFAINNLEYGTNNDLTIFKSFKALNWKFDLPENENPDFKRVVLTKKLKNNVFYAQDENNQDILLELKFFGQNKSNGYIPDNLVGKSVLVELYQYFTAINVTVSEFPENKFSYTIKEKPKINNFNISNFNEKIIDINNSQFVLLSRNIFTNITLNKTFNSNLVKIFVFQNYNLNKNGIFKLEQINNFMDTNIYYFSIKNTNTMIATFIENNPNLSYNLGKYFSMNIAKLTLANNVEQDNNGNFIFISIKDDKFIFRDLDKNKFIFSVLRSSKTPSVNDSGKRFNLNYIDFLLSDLNIDVTN